jgi:hypothetical protein
MDPDARLAMGAPPIVAELVARFERNLETYRSASYNETQVRREFIDPLFMALGWDIENRQGYAEAYKDVIHEDAIKVGGATKAPDYCFRVGGRRIFFLEAKKPAVNVRAEVSPAYQLRRYAWSAKLPLSILTDFEELAVYDCRVRPDPADKASTGRILLLRYTDYVDRWDELANIFSRDAVLKGSFDKFAEGTRLKRGTAEVDAAFLEEIESWRKTLAKNFAVRNPDLDTRELNFAVQRTIDRVIFLRMCEDRGVELYGQLQSLLNGEASYRRLCELFRLADERYNSGLFHFQPEKDRVEAPDELTTRLALDDKPLKGIIRNLYYPESPYEFSVLPAEILGQVYEQFLGKVIRLTSGHRAVVEDKPEVKKAGGVYYTPAYIVEYIVRQTVGKLVEGRNPRQIAKLRVLDPACGSGSFLVGAYTFLLDWHRDWYVNDGPAKHTRVLYQGAGGQWHVTTAEKKRILLNNIYGVDIDTQAVEVTKLSLLLKVLEDENRESLERQRRFLHERALPDLGGNIKCGNSLIGPDFYNGQQRSLLDEEEQYHINEFDWQTEFPTVLQRGAASGFDAIIGNPPYIPIEVMSAAERKYFTKRYPQLQRKFDSSVIFILAMLGQLSKHGRLGFISSITWQTGENFAGLREHLFQHAGIIDLVNLPFDVFRNAYVDTGIYILSAERSAGYRIYRYPKTQRLSELKEDSIPFVRIPTSLIRAPDHKIILDPKAQAILRRFEGSAGFSPLGSFTISTQGLAGNRFTTSTRQKGKSWYPYVQKGQVYRFALQVQEQAYAQMKDHPSLCRFYEAVSKILIRRVINRQDRLMAACTDRQLVFKKDVNPFIIVSPVWDPWYVLGVINSKLISYLYVNTSSIATKDDFRQTTLAELRRLPIPDSARDPSRTRTLISLVKEMANVLSRRTSVGIPDARIRRDRRVATLDRQIDQLVYELYGLTDDEIALVEGNVTAAEPNEE